MHGLDISTASKINISYLATFLSVPAWTTNRAWLGWEPLFRIQMSISIWWLPLQLHLTQFVLWFCGNIKLLQHYKLVTLFYISQFGLTWHWLLNLNNEIITNFSVWHILFFLIDHCQSSGLGFPVQLHYFYYQQNYYLHNPDSPEQKKSRKILLIPTV